MPSSDDERDIRSWRHEYADHGLNEADLDPDPIVAFGDWLDAAHDAGVHEPNAMVVSTATSAGVPLSRMVLLKGVDERGFVFYTNLESRKGDELRHNSATSLLFPWHPLERQIRIEGVATLVDRAEVDAYFEVRPRGSRLGAWASPQSRPVDGRSELDALYASVEDRFASADEVPTPPQWGGYRIHPHRIEFWQGRPGRMHDRIVYDRPDNSGRWTTSRLAP